MLAVGMRPLHRCTAWMATRCGSCKRCALCTLRSRTAEPAVTQCARDSYSYSGVGFNYLIAVLCIEWALVILGFWNNVQANSWVSILLDITSYVLRIVRACASAWAMHWCTGPCAMPWRLADAAASLRRPLFLVFRHRNAPRRGAV